MKLLILTIRLIFITLLIPKFSIAQTIQSISGKVVNSNNELLMGNAIAMDASDSAFIKGVSFLNGEFELHEINKKEVLLKLSSIQFADTIMYVQYKGKSTYELGTIMVKEGGLSLEAIEIVSQAPLFTHKADGTVEVNVANTILASSTTIDEILIKSPNIIIEDDEISVFGKGEALLFLNGRRISNEQLSSLSPAQIKSIEIISNPSSRYDAEGGAVVNIITNVNLNEGYRGTASQSVTLSEIAGGNTHSNFNMDFKKGKLSMLGNYQLQLGKNREILNTTRTRPQAEDYYKSDLQTDWKEKLLNYSNHGLGIQYDLNDKSYVSSEYRGFVEKLGGSVKSKNHILTNTMDGIFGSVIHNNDFISNHSITVNYNSNLDSLGSSIFIGSQYSKFNSDVDDLIDEHSKINDQESNKILKNKVNRGISIVNGQVDYTKIFSNLNKLEIGVKVSKVQNQSNSDFFTSDQGENFILDFNRSNYFNYEEKIGAAYISFNGLLQDKFNYRLGLRGEGTTYQLTTRFPEEDSFEDSYLNLFPNLAISSKIENKPAFISQFGFSYSLRIRRPRYQQLNPSVIYQDAFTTIEGNPDLIPQKTHAFEIWTRHNQIELKAGYNYTLDPLDASALQGRDPNTYVLKALNLKKRHSYFSSLSIPITSKWWSSMNTINLNIHKNIDDQYDFS
ncbi:outer membrane beta-barrel family protein, partial [Xanthovirga aplysinae]|uniref:outer membrane beta-barrel family protein n=1 Tax=Xanthovirga aplysinae TaxID=2529853 RepID=UPI0012BB7A8C